MNYKNLKHTFKKGLPFPVEVILHTDLDKETYWIEVNGCQESNTMNIPNVDYVDDPEKLSKFRMIDELIDKGKADELDTDDMYENFTVDKVREVYNNTFGIKETDNSKVLSNGLTKKEQEAELKRYEEFEN